MRLFPFGSAVACPFGYALAYELAQVFYVVTRLAPEIAAVSFRLCARTPPAWVKGEAICPAKAALRAEFVFIIGCKLATRYGRDGQRAIRRQRLKDRADRFVQLFQTRKHAIVFLCAENGSVLFCSCPVRLRCHAPRSAQHVDEFQKLFISFHVSPLNLKTSICSRRSCLPRYTRHFAVESVTPRNAAILFSGISS